MPQKQTKIKGVKLDCEECGAEYVLAILYAPSFMDLVPQCPFCGKVAGEVAG